MLLLLSSRTSSNPLHGKYATHRNDWLLEVLALAGSRHLSEPLQDVIERLDISIDSSSLLITQGNFLKQFEQTVLNSLTTRKLICPLESKRTLVWFGVRLDA